MKYFEVIEPYYALIKAGSEEEAIELYDAVVADDLPEQPIKDEIKEIERYYALSKVAEAQGFQDHTVKEFMTYFRREKNEVLLIDGSLL